MRVAESGISSRADVEAARDAGADAVLVGTALMRAPGAPGRAGGGDAVTLVKICGLTRDEDVDAAVAAGADMVGFVLVPDTPRYVELDRARALAARVPARRRRRSRWSPSARGRPRHAGIGPHASLDSTWYRPMTTGRLP